MNLKCLIFGHLMPKLPLNETDGLYCQRCLKELWKKKYKGKFEVEDKHLI